MPQGREGYEKIASEQDPGNIRVPDRHNAFVEKDHMKVRTGYEQQGRINQYRS
jgi:hypothetical protein